uniref:Uncharacterized protein n=1 Tax=Clytia hemisphaerica TaxID=252671 RepID=A0A7M5UPB2_9CNID
MDQERIKLYRDKGASSLRNHNQFHLYSRQKNSTVGNKGSDTKIAQAFRKLSRLSITSNSSTKSYNRHYDDLERGECSHSNNNNDETENLPTFRKISISKRKRRERASLDFQDFMI